MEDYMSLIPIHYCYNRYLLISLKTVILQAAINTMYISIYQYITTP